MAEVDTIDANPGEPPVLDDIFETPDAETPEVSEPAAPAMGANSDPEFVAVTQIQGLRHKKDVIQPKEAFDCSNTKEMQRLMGLGAVRLKSEIVTVGKIIQPEKSLRN